MARRPKKVQSQGMFQALKTWQINSGLNENPLISKLASDIENSENLNIWADLNPDDYLPLPESKGYLARSRRIDLISGVRNILVFTPVALTWAAISVVTAAFSRYEKANPNSLINFLEFWQQGYGYISDFWRLSSVAGFDVILVLFIIVLTYLVSQLTRNNFKQELVEVRDIENSRSLLVMQLNEYFHEFKNPTPSQINRNIYIATKSLNKTVQSLTKMVSRLEKDISKYPNSTNIVKELKNIDRAIKKLSKK